MNTPGGYTTPGGKVYPIRKFPSMASVQTAHTVQTMASLGFLAPGHGFVPRKNKLEKPFGPSFKTIMNRTERGPGKQFLTYAYVCFALSALCFLGVALYYGHRNIHRMMVYRTEVFGSLMVIGGILFFGAGINLLYKARVESNRWRSFITFKPEGMFTAAASNPAYVAEESMELQTGTFGERAITQIPKSRTPYSKNTKWGSQPNLRAARSIERGLDDPRANTGRRAPPYDNLRSLGRSSPALHHIPEETLSGPVVSGSAISGRKFQPPPPHQKYAYQPSRPAPLPPPPPPPGAYEEAPESEL